MAAVTYTDNGLLDTSFGTEVRLFFGGTANIAPWPGRRFMLASGNAFSTARLLNGAREVNAFALDASATESTTNTGSHSRLPVDPPVPSQLSRSNALADFLA
jgi:hypothetical protein